MSGPPEIPPERAIGCAFCNKGRVSIDDPNWREKAAEHVLSCPKHPLAEIAKRLEEAQANAITADWQNEVRGAFIEAGVPDTEIDGGGCDSGDSFDFTLCEIHQGINFLEERAEAAESALTALPKQIIAELKKDHRCPEWANHEQGLAMLERSVAAVEGWIAAALKIVLDPPLRPVNQSTDQPINESTK